MMTTTTTMNNVRLVRETSPLSTTTTMETMEASAPSPSPSPWKPIVEDEQHQSYAYWLPFLHKDEEDGGHPTTSWTTRSQLDAWFDALHPSNYDVVESNAATTKTTTRTTIASTSTTSWTDAYHHGDKLLRQTAWVTLDDRCQCEYGYADTWQPRATHPNFIRTLQEITNVVFKNAIGITTSTSASASTDSTTSTTSSTINAVNLNYYPRGGGIGFHADDEFLFDGTNRPTCIVSLSLCRASKNKDSGGGSCGASGGAYDDAGARQFVVKRRPPPNEQQDSVQEFASRGGSESGSGGSHATERRVILRHGDLMTMEGMFQKYYFHAVWPGDAQDYVASDHPWTQGERINLTWRTIVQHLDGSPECRGKTCPLATAKCCCCCYDDDDGNPKVRTDDFFRKTCTTQYV